MPISFIISIPKQHKVFLANLVHIRARFNVQLPLTRIVELVDDEFSVLPFHWPPIDFQDPTHTKIWPSRLYTSFTPGSSLIS